MRKTVWISLPLLTSICLYASTYPWNISVLAWVALVPLTVFALREEKGWKVFWLSAASGYLYFVLAFQWTTYSVPVAPYVLALYLGMYFPLFCMLIRFISRTSDESIWIAVPLAWTVCEYLRGTCFSGLPWFLLGHTQHPFPHLIQIADITGVYGLSFLVAMGNALIAGHILGEGRRRYDWIFVGVLLLVFLYGAVRTRTILVESGPRIAVIQANIPEDIRKDSLASPEEMERKHEMQIATNLGLTREGLIRGPVPPDLVVWPESGYPYRLWADLESRQFFTHGQYQRLLNTSRMIGVPWVTGCPVIESRPEWMRDNRMRDRHYRDMKRYNSALYFGKDAELLNRYDKIRLVPFVEYIPVGKGLMEWAVSQFSMITDAPDMTPGGTLKTMNVAGNPFGVLICYEGIFPWMTRDLANQGARFMVNISNDGWFRDSAELDQMLVMARFRAVESRTGFVRATNTGISAFIAPTGEVEEWIQGSDGRRKEVSGIMTRNVSWTRGSSLYRWWGDLFAQLVCLVTLWTLIVPFLRQTRPGPVNFS